jgi:multidrug resistance efflux pump
MELLMILTYAAICIAIFKIFKIPLNKWTVPTAVLGGVFLIAGVLLLMNYNHPYTAEARFFYYTTPIYAYARGVVTDVPVVPNQPLKKGDVLFRLDPAPFQAAVDQKKAALAEAEQNARQLKASYEQAAAGLARAKSQVELAQKDYERQLELFKKGVVAAAVADVSSRNLQVSIQTMQAASAEADRARLAAESEIGGVNTTVARLQGELEEAEYSLDQATVRAPTDGYVQQLFLRPGVLAVPLRPMLIFFHSDQSIFVAAFQQNSLQRLELGAEAEIAFAAVPGRVFQGRVSTIAGAVADGQLQTTGELINFAERKDPGRSIAVIDILDDMTPYHLPPGAVGQVATYTHHFHHFAMIRRILLRMESWLNYVFTEGHMPGGGH